MNITLFFAIAVLGSVAANLIHWSGRNGERFFYQPQSGWLRSIFLAWSIACVAAAVLGLFGRISGPAFMGIMTGFAIAQELHSIARRQGRRAGV
jgi:hypothetical protein